MNEDTLNNTADKIIEMYDMLRNAIRNYVFRVLEDNNASEDNPLECNVFLEYNACGLLGLEMLCVESLFQDDDGSGMIWCNVDWSDEPVDFDSLYTEDQMNVVSNL